MVLTSVLSLSEMDTEFSWPNDIFNSPFIPLKGPVFLIELELHDEGPAYSNQLSDFERVLISCFDKGIDVTQVDTCIFTFVISLNIAATQGLSKSTCGLCRES